MPRAAVRVLAIAGAALMTISPSARAFTPRLELEIHIINVQQANAAVVIGPGVDGKRVLLDAGHRYTEDSETLPDYLDSISLLPADGFHYTFASHLHTDHIRDFETLFVDGGYVVHGQATPTTCINCYNGSNYNSTAAGNYRTSWLSATGGGNPVPVQVLQPPSLPQTFPIGDGATIEVLAANCQIAGNTPFACGLSDENDKSIVLLITYGDFQFLWGGDANGETSDCYDAPGSKKNIEGRVVEAISPSGSGVRRLTSEGVDVLHVNHHGSETSTCAGWMNTMRPEVAIISVGRNTDGNPEPQVVDNILLAGSAGGDCVTVDPALVLQNDEGELIDFASDSGFVVGDIIIRSDGSTFSIETTGRVSYGPNESGLAGLDTKQTFLVDEVATDCPMVRLISDPTLVHQPDQEFKAKHHVGNKGSFIVQAGGEALFEAGTQIVLSNGFTIEDLGQFAAAIRPLSDCS